MDSEIPRTSDIATINAVYNNQANIKSMKQQNLIFTFKISKTPCLPYFNTRDRK